MIHAASGEVSVNSFYLMQAAGNLPKVIKKEPAGIYPLSG